MFYATFISFLALHCHTYLPKRFESMERAKQVLIDALGEKAATDFIKFVHRFGRKLHTPSGRFYQKTMLISKNEYVLCWIHENERINWFMRH